MAVDQLPEEVREFASFLDGLMRRLDQDGGWCGVFWQRDPDGMRACLDGREVPPWDVVEALLQDLGAEHGVAVAAREAGRARSLHGASLAAFDARPGGRDALGDRLDVMLRERRYAAERRTELNRLLGEAATPEDAEAVRLDLAWAQDDHERATARCAELRDRAEDLDRRALRAHAPGGPGLPGPWDAAGVRRAVVDGERGDRPGAWAAEGAWGRHPRPGPGADDSRPGRGHPEAPTPASSSAPAAPPAHGAPAAAVGARADGDGAFAPGEAPSPAPGLPRAAPGTGARRFTPDGPNTGDRAPGSDPAAAAAAAAVGARADGDGAFTPGEATSPAPGLPRAASGTGARRFTPDEPNAGDGAPGSDPAAAAAAAAVGDGAGRGDDGGSGSGAFPPGRPGTDAEAFGTALPAAPGGAPGPTGDSGVRGDHPPSGRPVSEAPARTRPAPNDTAFGPAGSGARVDAHGIQDALRPEATAPFPYRDPEIAPGGGGSGSAPPAPAFGFRPDAYAPDARPRDGASGLRPGGDASGLRPGDDASDAVPPRAGARPATPESPTPGGAGRSPGRRSRRRPRGSARFAGLTDAGTAPVPGAAVPPPAAPAAPNRRTPRGARFAGAAEERPEPMPAPGTEPPDEDAGRDTAETVERLLRLRAEGRSGEAHATLVEAAHWPAARFPLLAAELREAGLDADWATLLWEAASLPADRLVAAFDALVAAGRAADGRQMLRQGVARPAPEIGAAVLGLADEGRRREIRALLDAYVRVRTPEEAARSAESDPARLVPLLLDAARGISERHHWDLVHGLRVAGFAA
ncbi:hypothetical protein [Streptomyces sp. NPDC047990]|uniref:hypothetical protein n=1 Tax=Streptomyces sp. NPDC047990 TaxID=3365496 RepID=UPI00371EEC1A